MGLYDLDLQPQVQRKFSEPVTFPNQGEAINWRFWVARAGRCSAAVSGSNNHHNIGTHAAVKELGLRWQ